MFRLLGKIEIFGTKSSVNKFALVAAIPDGVMMQTGLKRKVPDIDSWYYASPWYRFDFEATDQGVRDFLTAHLQVGEALAIHDAEISYAFFTLCPVQQSNEEVFSGIFGRETLKMLVDMGLELQIAPATTMPDAPYWKR